MKISDKGCYFDFDGVLVFQRIAKLGQALNKLAGDIAEKVSFTF